jgi:hypothetical protein
MNLKILTCHIVAKCSLKNISPAFQEYRFNQYCERLQNLIMQKLDDEFKMFMRWRGFNIDSGLFNIKFTAPQNFASYRETELDTSRVNTFAALEPLPYLSKRFLLERYLGLSKEEIVENEKMWREERDQPDLQTTQGQDLRSIGITPAGLEADIQTGQELSGLGGPGAELAPGTAPGVGTAGTVNAPPAGPAGAPPVPTI